MLLSEFSGEANPNRPVRGQGACAERWECFLRPSLAKMGPLAGTSQRADMSQPVPTPVSGLALKSAPFPRSSTISGRVCEIRTDIEALRAVAILLVVAFHCHIFGISGGFMGVDVFFVLSGYLITGLLVTEVESTSRLNLLQFYARRIRRLVPAASLMLLVTLLVGALVLAPNELNLTGRAARATALYASNIFFARRAADYFSAQVMFNPLLHTWSLAVEEQFYLVWPLLIVLGLSVWHSKRALTCIMMALTVLSLGGSGWLTEHDHVIAFFELPPRAWEFGIGGLAALIPRDALQLSQTAWLVIGWLGVTVILGSCVFVTSRMPFPGWAATIPVIGTAITLISGAAQPHRGVGALFDASPLQKLGGLSYSWYLWHWPFLVFTAAFIPGASAIARALAATAALAVACITHRYVENPIRHNPYLKTHSRLSFALGAALVAMCLAASMLSLRFAAHLADTPKMKALVAASADFATLPRRQCVSADGSSAVTTCTFGSSTSTTNVVLFGDSHAAQWFNALGEIAEREHWRLTTVIKFGCAAADVNPGRGIDDDPECEAWRKDAIHRIISLGPSLVLLGSATNKLGRPENPATHADPALLADVREGVLRTLRPLDAAGLRVALIRDTPEFPFNVVSCLERSARSLWPPRGTCEMPRGAVIDRAIYAAEKSSAAGLPNVKFIDLTDQLCPQGVCDTVRNDLVMYRDTHHLTSASAANLALPLEQQVLSAMAR
jgi:peptidoglycan/LPS O-acetylase OafA/YrhL